MAESQSAPLKRHPIRNFIILPELQWPYIIRLMAIVNLTGVVMATAICALFYWRYRSGPLGQDLSGDMVNQGVVDVLVEKNLMDVILPAFLIADLVSLAIGMGLALYFSRKISVPIYRIRRWAEDIAGGNLSSRLRFRPGDDLQSVEESVNRASEAYLEIIADLRRRLAEANPPSPAAVEGTRSATASARASSAPAQNA